MRVMSNAEKWIPQLFHLKNTKNFCPHTFPSQPATNLCIVGVHSTRRIKQDSASSCFTSVLNLDPSYCRSRPKSALKIQPVFDLTLQVMWISATSQKNVLISLRIILLCVAPLSDKIKPGPHDSAKLYLLRVKKSIYYSLIRLRNRSGEMEQSEVMDLNCFYCKCEV